MKIFDACAGTGSVGSIFLERGHDVHGVDLYPEKCGSPAWVIKGNILEMAKDPLGWLDKYVAPGWRPDHFHGSPPCQGFAVPSIGRMWVGEDDEGQNLKQWTGEEDAAGIQPKHRTAVRGLRLLEAVVHIIQVLLKENPAMTYTIENPRAMMRRAIEEHHPWLGAPKEVSYCRYGPMGPVEVVDGPPMVWAKKDSDIWSNLPNWEPLACDALPPKAMEGPGPHGMLFVFRDGQPCHERAARGTRCGIQRMKTAEARGKIPRSLSLAWCEAAEAVAPLGSPRTPLLTPRRTTASLDAWFNKV